MKLFFPEWIILFPSTSCLCNILLFLKNALLCLICLANTDSFFKTLCNAFFDPCHLPQASLPWVDCVLVLLSLTHILIKYCNAITYWHLVSPIVIPRKAWWDSWAQSLSVSRTFPEFQGGRYKQLLIKGGRGCKTRRETTLLTWGKVLVPHQQVHKIISWSCFADTEPPAGRRYQWLTMVSYPQHAVVAVVQLLSCVPLCDPTDCSMPGSPSFTVSWSLLRFLFIDSVMLCNISPSAAAFSFCLQYFLASTSFPINQLFASRGQDFGTSASAFVLLMNSQGWFPLGSTGLISLQSKGLSRVFSNTTIQKHQFFSAQPFFMVQLSHPYMTTGKTKAFTVWLYGPWSAKWCLCFLIHGLGLSQLFFWGGSIF